MSDPAESCDGSVSQSRAEGPSDRGNFSSQFGFIMAATGSAVGLGNIWKFPYITGEYGGGAFVLVYLMCVAAVGLPLMYAEVIIGQRGGKDVWGALRSLNRRSSTAGAALSHLTGMMAIAASFLILAFYSVVAGWAIHFLVVSLGLVPGCRLADQETFQLLESSAAMSSLWHSAFMLLTILVVAGGVHHGIERACKRLMPSLVLLLLLMLGYVAFNGGLRQSVAFLFWPDFSKMSGEAVLEALGHAFFTLSLGMGIMVTYGSYLKGERYVIRDAVAIAGLDTLIALLAGAVIFAVVFHAGQDPNRGPQLLFVTLPHLFAEIPAGNLVGAAFFLLVIFAAWLSGISLLEVVVAYFVDEWGWKRSRAAWAMGGGIWVLGIGCASWSSMFDQLDDLTTRYMLPLGGFCIALAAGWFVSADDRQSGFRPLGRAGEMLAPTWTFTIRFVTPVLVLAIILWQLGLLDI